MLDWTVLSLTTLSAITVFDDAWVPGSPTCL
jgi:hypothetical protein